MFLYDQTGYIFKPDNKQTTLYLSVALYLPNGLGILNLVCFGIKGEFCANVLHMFQV